jgi:fido (protein-threonine AMPylation protein)
MLDAGSLERCSEAILEDSRTYSVEEDRALALNLRALAARIRSGELSTSRFSVDLICEIHRAIFEGIRGHAGRTRSRSFGQEHLSFGPNRSLHRSDVADALEKLAGDVRRSLASLDDHPTDPAFEPSALHLAVWTHAELIRIHPFEDGNGRSGRAVMSWILVRLGLRPIAFEMPKDEYLLCLNVYFTMGDLTPLIDLTLGCYRD